MIRKGIPHAPVALESVGANRFQKAIRNAKHHNRPRGWMVTKHDRREYKGMRMFLATDRSMGVAITKSGDVVSVFSNGKHPKALEKLIPFAVVAGGRTLDCFGAGLQNLYAKFGAKALGAGA